jgi:hypothetical protein
LLLQIHAISGIIGGTIGGPTEIASEQTDEITVLVPYGQ